MGRVTELVLIGGEMNINGNTEKENWKLKVRLARLLVMWGGETRQIS